jgi:NADH:ubiquinone reductase (H+-translocating)
MKKRVVIVGAGFGGLTCAQELKDVDVDVTVLDRSNHHLFQPLLYQVATSGLSPADIAAPIRSVLSQQNNARVLLAEMLSVDFDRRIVRLDVSPGEIAFDYLVLATGAKTNYFGHAEWEACAPGLKSIADAVEIRTRVLLAFERAEREQDPQARQKYLQFVVIGAGPTGVELAGAVAELARTVLARDFRVIRPSTATVTLIEAGERVLSDMVPKLSKAAQEQLEEIGVVVRTGCRVTKLSEHGVELNGAEFLPAKTILWAAGVEATSLTATLGVALDHQHRVRVDSFCAIPGHSNVFAIGDMARFEEAGAPLPGVSPVALQQAAYVAAVIAQELAGSPPARTAFRYVDKGTMATIGRKRAVAQVGDVHLRGATAWFSWLFVHLWFLVGFRNRFVVLFTWFWSYVSFQRGARIIGNHGAQDPK